MIHCHTLKGKSLLTWAYVKAMAPATYRESRRLLRRYSLKVVLGPSAVLTIESISNNAPTPRMTITKSWKASRGT